MTSPLQLGCALGALVVIGCGSPLYPALHPLSHYEAEPTWRTRAAYLMLPAASPEDIRAFVTVSAVMNAEIADATTPDLTEALRGASLDPTLLEHAPADPGDYNIIVESQRRSVADGLGGVDIEERIRCRILAPAAEREFRIQHVSVSVRRVDERGADPTMSEHGAAVTLRERRRAMHAELAAWIREQLDAPVASTSGGESGEWSVLWTASLRGSVSWLGVDAAQVAFASGDGVFLVGASGSVTELLGSSHVRPALAPGGGILAADGPRLSRFDRTGTLRWAADVADVPVAVGFVGDRAIALLEPPRAECSVAFIDDASGASVGQATLPGLHGPCHAWLGSAELFVGSDDGPVVAVDTARHVRVVAPADPSRYLVGACRDTALVGERTDLRAFRPSGPTWRTPLDNLARGTDVGCVAAGVVTVNGSIAMLGSDGALRWTSSPASSPIAPPVELGDALWFVTVDGVAALDRDGHERVVRPMSPGTVSTLATRDGVLLIGFDDGRVQAVRP